MTANTYCISTYIQYNKNNRKKKKKKKRKKKNSEKKTRQIEADYHNNKWY
jgi:hypothetical protein